MTFIQRNQVLRIATLAILAIVVLFVSAPAAWAEDTAPTTNYQVVIYDGANVLTDEEEQMLQDDMMALRDYGNVVFTTVELADWSYEKFAEDTYYNLFGNEPGVLLQIDMGNRKITLSASEGMEDRIGSERDSIVDNIYKMATAGDYYGCARECFKEIDQVINGQEIAHRMKHIDNAIFALILALLINFLVVFATTRKRVNKKRILGEVAITAAVADLYIEQGRVTKRKRPRSSGGGGGGHSGGGGFHGGGGGFHGGSSSHGF